MIRCTKCQTINPEDAVFCSGCASFLEWTGERISAEEAEASKLAAAGEAQAAGEVEAAGEAEAPGEGETPQAPTEAAAPAETVVEGVPAKLEAPAEPPAGLVPEVEAPAAPVEAAAPVRAEPAPAKREVATRQPPAPPPEPAAPPPQPAPPPETPAPPPEPLAAAPQPAMAGPEPVPPPPAPVSVEPPPEAAPLRGAPPPAAPQAQEPPARRPTAPSPTPERRRRAPPPEPQQPEAPPEQPAARRPVILPAEPPRPRPQPTPPPRSEPEIRPGDLICAVCGTANEPSRRFCRRCGSSLAAAVVAVRQPWYRRIFARQRRVGAAGERPRRMGEAGQPRRSPLGRIASLLIVAVAAGAVVGYLFVPPLHQRVDALVADLRLSYLPEISDLHPPQASGEGVDGHTGDLAVDDNTATYWLADPAGATPTLTVELDAPTNLGGLIFHSGSATDSSFAKHRRPERVELSFPGTEQPPIELDLKDQSEPQASSLDVRGVSTVVIHVVSWFEAGAGGDQLIALREIEFKERR